MRSGNLLQFALLTLSFSFVYVSFGTWPFGGEGKGSLTGFQDEAKVELNLSVGA